MLREGGAGFGARGGARGAAAVAAALLLGSSGIAPAARAHDAPHVVAAVAPGTVDWSEGMIVAWGEAAPPAGAANAQVARVAGIRAAREEAFRNLAATIGAIPLTAELTAGERMAASDSSAAAVKRLIAAAVRVMEPEVSAEGRARIAMGVRIAPPLLAALLGGAAPAGDDSTAANGIVVDCTGLGVTAALAPRVLDPAGAVLLGPGIARYVRSVEDAVHEGLVRPAPLVARGRRALGRHRADVEVAAADAERIRAAGASPVSPRPLVFLLD